MPPDQARQGPAWRADAALAAAEAKAQENWNSYRRAVAELDNYRKRMERELDNARKYAIERFAQELLPVSDALEAGIKSGAANPAALLEGAQATLRELQRAFDKAGIKIIDPHRSALRSELARSHGGPGEPGAAPQHGAVGDPEGLLAQRPVAQTGARDREQSTRRGQLKMHEGTPKVAVSCSNFLEGFNYG